jgi:DNA-binding CsgD family transcriptional regulator
LAFFSVASSEKAMTALTRKPASSGPDAPENKERRQVDDLIRQLISQLARMCEPVLRSEGEYAHEEIMIDVNVDGMRYLLVRMPSPAHALVALTPREHEIVRMVAKGYPNKTIAGVLNISSWTVCTHLRRTFAKLGVASRAAMVARLLEDGRVWDQTRANDKPLARPPPSSTSTSLRPANVSVSKRPAPDDALPPAVGQRSMPRQKDRTVAAGSTGKF